MKCPHCETPNTQVENSRETKKSSAIWRRRNCLNCKKVFSTYEKVGLDFLIVEKRSGKRTRYLSHKLFASIYEAASGGKHTDRGDAAMLAEEVLSRIESKLVRSQSESVTTSAIIDMVTDALETRDLGACYRYAAFSPHRGMKFGI